MGDEDKPMGETPEAATEQRADDYDALVRRIDDALGKLDDVLGRLDKVDDLAEALGKFLDTAKIETDTDGKDNDGDGQVDESGEVEEINEIDLTTPLEELDFDLD